MSDARQEAERRYPPEPVMLFRGEFDNNARLRRAFLDGAQWRANQPVEVTDEMVEKAGEALFPGLFSLTDDQYSVQFDNDMSFRRAHQRLVKDEVRFALETALGGKRE